VAEFHIGVAVKPSTLGSTLREKRRRLLRIVGLASSIGLELVVIDSERAVDDVRPADVEEAARLSESLGGPCIVPTVPVRRRDSEALLPRYLKALARSSSMGLCIVAGNPAYLGAAEASQRPGRFLWAACRAAAEVADEGLLLLGTESVEGVAMRICESLDFKPFLLLDEGVEDDARSFAQVSRNGVAVYAPFYIGDGVPAEVERVLIAYASRRRGLARVMGPLVGLGEALRVSLVGVPREVAGRVAGLACCSVDTLVGFPAELSPRQLREFYRALKGLLEG